MILILSDANVTFNEEENGLFSKSVSGYGFNVAKSLSSRGAFPALFCPLGNDRSGAEVAGELVKNAILFDPDLIQLPFRTNVVIEYKDGSEVSFFTASASSYLPQEALAQAMSLNTDISVILTSSNMLSVNPTAASIIDQSLFLSPRPFFVVDMTVSPEGPSLARSISMIKGNTDALIMREGNAYDDLMEEKNVIVRSSEEIRHYEYGKLKCTLKKGVSLTDEDFASSLMLFLDRNLPFAEGNAITEFLAEL